MAKRVTKAESKAIVALIIIGAPIYLVVKAFQLAAGPIIIFVLVALVIWILAKWFSQKMRRSSLMSKYQDANIVELIMRKTIWVGQTQGQLIDSLGSPVDTDQKVLKTKQKIICKYHHQGGNRYGLRVTVENGAVVGWDEKI